MLRIGIDVGGTNTDAVVMDGRDVLSAVKTSTTGDVTSGVREAMEQALGKAGIARERVAHVMIGTTHFTNAVIERNHLSKVAAIRLGLPAAACLPPMVDWPDDLRAAVGGHGYMLRGGYEYHGRILSDLDLEGLDRVADDIAKKGIGAAAITSIFGPVNDAMERRTRDHLLTRIPDLKIVLSSKIGRIGLLERESAAIMNAALLDLADITIVAFGDAVKACGLACGFSITQNDGTLMDADRVRRFPVLTFASGPTNSLRGAAFLTGITDAIVVDIGGTTSDIGALANGFPRQASSVVDIGGVRTNFRMPDVFAVGLGGGSLVADDGKSAGPQSVGYRIAKEARVFGGSALTATDIAVRLGKAAIGDPAKVASIPASLAERAMTTITQTLERAVERCRLSADPIPVITVGGGSILMPDRLGDLEVIRPANFGVANAVGAAIAQISGEVDRIVSLEGTTRKDALAAAEDEARRNARAAGAMVDTIEVIEREDVPLAYLPGNATRIRVRVVGDMEALQ
ncbi:hydantoinase/oxoprolinase N-terminal domain-containing protein [Roseibium marinum]|uniref:N-methylhydantoinase A/oxoprolinase/acetone carboxylase beta subunit n=1 Tax=Roseibium marinum TaxID=281252 RepID=A0A2S3UN12_9HYPH|nr:hydantoinase/oxoprolinase family protein [Roseibium marinum]POF29107.1 N-methylhydantoinase A/oxoprolinase/acetone carboxylase beta subunit [Roseibium marinum]